MPKPKFYAVYVGRVPDVYASWDECRTQTERFPGCRFEGFGSRVEATVAYRNKTGKEPTQRSPTEQAFAAAAGLDLPAADVMMAARPVDGAGAGGATGQRADLEFVAQGLLSKATASAPHLGMTPAGGRGGKGETQDAGAAQRVANVPALSVGAAQAGGAEKRQGVHSGAPGAQTAHWGRREAVDVPRGGSGSRTSSSHPEHGGPTRTIGRGGSEQREEERGETMDAAGAPWRPAGGGTAPGVATGGGGQAGAPAEAGPETMAGGGRQGVGGVEARQFAVKLPQCFEARFQEGAVQQSPHSSRAQGGPGQQRQGASPASAEPESGKQERLVGGKRVREVPPHSAVSLGLSGAEEAAGGSGRPIRREWRPLAEAAAPHLAPGGPSSPTVLTLDSTRGHGPSRGGGCYQPLAADRAAVGGDALWGPIAERLAPSGGSGGSERPSRTLGISCRFCGAAASRGAFAPASHRFCRLACSSPCGHARCRQPQPAVRQAA